MQNNRVWTHNNHLLDSLVRGRQGQRKAQSITGDVCSVVVIPRYSGLSSGIDLWCCCIR